MTIHGDSFSISLAGMKTWLSQGFRRKAGCLLTSISVMARIGTNEWQVFSKEAMRYSSLMSLFLSQITEILTKFSFIF